MPKLPEDPLATVDALRQITSVVAPANAGTVGQYVECQRRSGKPAYVSQTGTEAWITGARWQLRRTPVFATSEPAPHEVRRLLREQGIWLVSYALQPDAQRPANAFCYQCRAAEYGMETLPSKSRNMVRKGFRNVQVRLCSWDELLEEGYAAYLDTDVRHGYNAPSRVVFEEQVGRCREASFFDVYGAWHKNKLVSWLTVAKVNDWADEQEFRSTTEHLTLGANNAVRYAALRHLLVVEKYQRVTSGASGHQVRAQEELWLHRNKISMGFEAKLIHRHYAIHPAVRPFICSKSAAWLWDKVAILFPRSYVLPRLVALSRFISGRADPLAWSQGGSTSA